MQCSVYKRSGKILVITAFMVFVYLVLNKIEARGDARNMKAKHRP